MDVHEFWWILGTFRGVEIMMNPPEEKKKHIQLTNVYTKEVDLWFVSISTKCVSCQNATIDTQDRISWCLLPGHQRQFYTMTRRPVIPHLSSAASRSSVQANESHRGPSSRPPASSGTACRPLESVPSEWNWDHERWYGLKFPSWLGSILIHLNPFHPDPNHPKSSQIYVHIFSLPYCWAQGVFATSRTLMVLS